MTALESRSAVILPVVLTSNLVFSAIILWNPIPTPSITASRHAQPIAEFLAALKPPRTANAPPVKKPAMTKEALAKVLQA